MYAIVLALCPAMVFGLVQFGTNAAKVVSVSIITCVASEYVLQRIFKKQITITDGSAVLSGLLFAMILPPTSAWWLVAVGAFMSMLIGKHVFGGLGSNPFNSALVGWAIVKISWKPQMDFNLVIIKNGLERTLTYPLGVLKAEGVEVIENLSIGDLFIGREIGGVGSTSGLLLLICGLILIVKGIIPWKIPFAFIIGIVVTSLIFKGFDSTRYAGPVFHLVTGYTIIGIFFLATDYSSTPVNSWAMILFGFGCGFITIFLRSLSYYPDGTVFGILLMNIVTPYLDKIGERRIIRKKRDI
jgi:electron transport complex protein RnfD